MANTSFQALQHKIRADALEQQSALSSLQSWQAEIKAKDASLKSITTKAALPQPRNARQSTDPASDATAAATTEQGAVSTPGKTTAADHTYDKGYKKWERFEVDEEDGGGIASVAASQNIRSDKHDSVISPADIFGSHASAAPAPIAHAKARTVLRTGNANERLDPAALEKERGNEAFREGKFQRAVEAYTRSLGYEPAAPLVLSNRAEAHLRLKDNRRALEDATAALKLLPGHVKTLLRRGRAAVACGRLREAMADLTAALQLEPDNKRVAAELRKAREQRRAAMQRAPRAPLQALVDAAAQRLKQDQADAPEGNSGESGEALPVDIPAELVYDV